MTELKGSGLKMWLYINKNQDNYRFELSRKACEDWGIKKDSYYDGFNDLVKHGYLRLSKEGSNVYHFFENALAENPPSGYSEFYFMENTKPATEIQKSTYGIPKRSMENPQRNNINNTRIIKDNKTSAFPKRETIEEAKKRLGFWYSGRQAEKPKAAATIFFRETMRAGSSRILIGVSAHYQNPPPRARRKEMYTYINPSSGYRIGNDGNLEYHRT